MEHETGVALGQASLTVLEQATMLATIDNGGIYHNAHIVASIGHNTQNSAPPIPIKITSYPVFSPDPTANKNLASQVQYAMSKDDAPYGTAPGAGMSNGQEIIAKTGTTDSAQSAFFIGAIPSQTWPSRCSPTSRAQGQADAGPARRAFPGRHGRYLAGLDLAHLRREHVRPARDRAVPHPRLHRPDLEPGAAEPA